VIEEGRMAGRAERQIAEFIVDTDAGAIPAECYRAAREASFDCAGVMLAGVPEPHGRMIVELASAEGGPGPCTIAGTSIRTSATMAALANGTLGHALDYDDMGGFGHPSVVLLPAALAAGEIAEASGRDVLTAYILGFEVARHLSRAATYHQGERGFHSTVVFGTLGAVAASSRLLGLSVEQTVMALGIAGSMPSGVVQNFGTHTKPLHAGMTCRNGVMAAMLARKGWLACDNIVESKVGWAAAYIGHGNYDPHAMVKDLGSEWTIQDTIVIKKYPCCGTNHSALDSLLALQREHRFRFDEVTEVEVTGLPDTSHVLLYPEPRYAFQGKFSLPYTVATALVDGCVDVDSFTDERLARGELAEALRKIEIKVVSRWDPAWSAHPRETPVTVRLANGRTLTRSTNRHTMRGTPADPLTADELREKFRRNALRCLSADRAERALDVWWTIDAVPRIHTAMADLMSEPASTIAEAAIPVGAAATTAGGPATTGRPTEAPTVAGTASHAGPAGGVVSGTR
jgi:2-methylcitrate dehydratase PrpD